MFTQVKGNTKEDAVSESFSHRNKRNEPCIIGGNNDALFWIKRNTVDIVVSLLIGDRLPHALYIHARLELLVMFS